MVLYSDGKISGASNIGFIFSWKTANHLDLAVLPGRRVTTT